MIKNTKHSFGNQIIQEPLILAAETSGRTGSAAIAIGEQILAETTLSAPMKHSAELFPAVCGLLNRFDRKPKEIKHVEISSSEETKLIGDVVFEEILKGKTKHRYAPYKRDYSFNKICDSHLFGTKGEHDLGVEIVTPMSDQYSQFDDSKCVMYTSEHYGHALFKLSDHKDFAREVRTYLQTDKYIRYLP